MSKNIKDRKSKINEYTKLARKREKRPDYYAKALKATWLDNKSSGEVNLPDDFFYCLGFVTLTYTP